MALGRYRRTEQRADYWPGFVDAMASLLLVMIFLLSVFMLAQFFLSQEISGKDSVLNRLNNQIAELTELLALERTSSASLNDEVADLRVGLSTLEAENERLQGLLSSGSGNQQTAEERINKLTENLDEEKATSARALSQVELLNKQISALRRQIGALEEALEASEKRDRESQTKIADLGKRLNVALAQKVQELSRFRSDFFGRLREILSQRSDIRVVGDRFVFQSEVLFGSGSDEIGALGQSELDKLASAIIELEGEIPSEINWVLRIDGHTDDVPLIGTGRLRDNWELSAARAISVVQYLVSKGVSSNRLVAAGFGEFQPLDTADTVEARNRNRRIELKLTER